MSYTKDLRKVENPKKSERVALATSVEISHPETYYRGWNGMIRSRRRDAQRAARKAVKA